MRIDVHGETTQAASLPVSISPSQSSVEREIESTQQRLDELLIQSPHSSIGRRNQFVDSDSFDQLPGLEITDSGIHGEQRGSEEIRNAVSNHTPSSQSSVDSNPGIAEELLNQNQVTDVNDDENTNQDRNISGPPTNLRLPIMEIDTQLPSQVRDDLRNTDSERISGQSSDRSSNSSASEGFHEHSGNIVHTGSNGSPIIQNSDQQSSVSEGNSNSSEHDRSNSVHFLDDSAPALTVEELEERRADIIRRLGGSGYFLNRESTRQECENELALIRGAKSEAERFNAAIPQLVNVHSGSIPVVNDIPETVFRRALSRIHSLEEYLGRLQ